ncbi:MAG: hypothetical protein NWS97_04600 [Limnohabitans sp.]|jgi:hypothetical protein|nr:hypothetical protein [Limnohabitans sp.]MDP4733633.1 hypothetical protein [Limnohabitans sp.]MDP4771502.1 hypothetical protein [Limnohabitans sp.]MDP4921954.1 hypothetical protein [Limnohabitans sp.]
MPDKKPQRPAPKPDAIPAAFWSILIAITVVVLGGLAVFLIMENATPKPMRVQVMLDNRCELIDDAFMAVSEPDGAKAVFVNRVAYLNTTNKAKILVKVNDKYPGFQFESGKSDAAPRVTIQVNCDSGDRTQRTLDAMKEQFKTR